jgi:hypothetical protein
MRMGELTLIYTTKGDNTKERGAWPPQGGRTKWKDMGCQVWEQGRHLSTHTNMCQQSQTQRGGRHLFELWAATSRRRHLSKRGAPLFSHMLISIKICNQSYANHFYLVPFDSLIDFSINFSPNLSPFIFFIFDLADFY